MHRGPHPVKSRVTLAATVGTEQNRSQKVALENSARSRPGHMIAPTLGTKARMPGKMHRVATLTLCLCPRYKVNPLVLFSFRSRTTEARFSTEKHSREIRRSSPASRSSFPAVRIFLPCEIIPKREPHFRPDFATAPSFGCIVQASGRTIALTPVGLTGYACLARLERRLAHGANLAQSKRKIPCR